MKRRESLGLDLTPVIDVIFILLIFFIVTSVFKKEELALILDLPTSSAKEMKIDDEQIFIELSKNKLGRIFIKYYYKHSPFWVEKMKNNTLINQLLKATFDFIIHKI